MKLWTKSTLFVMALALDGCGGGTGSGNVTKVAGTYDGSYMTSKGDYGDFTFTIDSNGMLTGTQSSFGGSTSTLTGSASTGGLITIGSGSTSMAGQIQKTSLGDYAFTATSLSDGSEYFTSYHNPTASSGATGVFSQLFAGYGTDESAVPETVIFTTDPLGDITGTVDRFQVIGGVNVVVHSSITGTIQSSGATSLSMSTSNGGAITLTGTLTINGKQVSGNLTDLSGHTLNLTTSIYP